MLIQSHTGTVQLLPALPEAWPSGEVKGLKARGGYEVDIKWENNELAKAVIRSERGQACKLRYKDKVMSVDVKQGGKQILRLTDF